MTSLLLSAVLLTLIGCGGKTSDDTSTGDGGATDGGGTDGGTDGGGTDGGTTDGGGTDGGGADGGGDTGGDGGGDTGGGDGGATTWAPVVVNEFMASNLSGLQDEAGAHPDWIALYNPTGADVSVAGWTMTDDLKVHDMWTLPALTVPAHGWLVLYADNDTADGDQHLGFSLSRKGEDLGLYAPDGTIMDELIYGEQATDNSAARVPDGTANWVITSHPSPGGANRK